MTAKFKTGDRVWAENDLFHVPVKGTIDSCQLDSHSYLVVLDDIRQSRFFSPYPTWWFYGDHLQRLNALELLSEV
jgi:hypothetical protein